MTEKRRERKEYLSWKKGYYHLSTDGWQEGLLFHTAPQFAYGMIVIGLLKLLFQVKIYEFTLMPNHIHIILSGTGEAIVQAFDFLKKRINKRLIQDGYPPLPKDYWFKLKPIKTEEQMRINILYSARNPYEKQFSISGGYPWGSAWLHHSILGRMVRGTRADAMSKRELERLCGTRFPIPPNWEFHPQIGLLPASFVEEKLFYKLFPSPKTYATRLIKEYEAFVKLGKSIGEDVEFSTEEINDIVEQALRNNYTGKAVKDLSGEETGLFCRQLNEQFNLSEGQIASVLGVQEYIVRQILNSKDFGKKRP